MSFGADLVYSGYEAVILQDQRRNSVRQGQIRTI